MLVISILTALPSMYISYDVNNEILIFCNVTENLQNFPICNERQYNNTDFIIGLSTWNLKIYNNITQEIKLKQNITYTSEFNFTKVDFNLFSLITQITLLVIYLVFYNSVLNQQLEVDIMNLSPADYTLMLSDFNLPYDLKDFEDLKLYLETEVINFK